MNRIKIIVTNNIWPFRWASSKATTVSTDMVLEAKISNTCWQTNQSSQYMPLLVKAGPDTYPRYQKVFNTLILQGSVINV